MRKFAIALYLITFGFNTIQAQTSFTEASDLLANQFVNSGAALGVADMNGDGLDDIIRLHSTTQLVIEHQTIDGHFENLITGISTPLSNWSLCIDDIDKNGANDVFLGTANFPHHIVWADESGKEYNMETLSGPAILPQGANFADIDNDGDSDLFVCNDNGTNFIYRNDGTQNLIYDTEILNTNTTPASDNSGNYASLWTDYDNDGDLDLYISKCRLGVVEVTDPRRINMLWENDGHGNFTEVAQQRGLVPFAQTWSTDFADIDNDGDLDVFMINHDTTSRLYENDGTGHYTDITSQAGFSPAIDNITVGIQAQFADFDGDNFVDLLISSSQGSYKYFRNNGDKSFSVIFGAFQTLDPMHSYAIGDLNNDGFLDLIAGFGMGYNNPTLISDKLFLNDGNSNNWSKIILKGTNSNINGVGARLEAHGSWGIMIREIRSGVSYGINNSLTAHFGLGSSSQIDSLVIKWPSGYHQVVANPNINETLIIEEEGCLNPPPTNLDASICEGDSLIFGTQNLTESGQYFEIYKLPEGCDSTVILNLTVSTLSNQNISLSVCEGDSYTFPDGSTHAITADTVHTSFFTSVNNCDSIITTSLNVLPTYSFSNFDEVCQGSSYTWPDGTSSVILDAQSQTSHLLNQYNCDSIIVTSVNIIPAPNSQQYDEICQGENYTFPDGNTIQINEDFIYEISFPNSQSCDSIVSYIITSLSDYNLVDSDQACVGDSYTFPDGTSFAGLTTSFSWTSHLTASTGCDSTILINLEVLEGSEFTEMVELCEGETYKFPDGSDQIIDQDLSYTSVLNSSNGCDSIIHTNIITKQSYLFTLSESICRGDSYTFFDGTTQFNIEEDLIHQTNFITFDGCDSIIMTDLTVIQPIEATQNILICQGDNYIFPDGSIVLDINEDFMQESLIPASNICDSLIITNVSVSPSYDQTVPFTICPGETIQIGDLFLENINSDTTIIFDNNTLIGCDSIFTYNINLEEINTMVTLDQATATAVALDVSYQWFDCTTGIIIEGATEQYFTPEIDGSYAAILEGIGCITETDCIDIIGTSLQDLEFSKNINLYPNPTQDQLEINFKTNNSLIKASIYNVQGQKLISFETKDEYIKVMTEQLDSGLYFIKFNMEENATMKKFIKE